MTSNQPELGVRSEKGRREENQDKMSAFSTPLGEVYIVADGMGGHLGGAEASRRVVEGYSSHLRSLPGDSDLGVALQSATAATNAEILSEGRSGNPAIAGMGSTVVLALLRPGPAGTEMLTAHIGDSRAYLVRNGVIRQLTRDHSAVQRMVDEQIITAEAARNHPDINVLTRAIGKHPDVAIEVGHLDPLYPGDIVLLCTDGLWGHVPDPLLLHELTVDRPASESADALIQLALDSGSDDNITLQILRIDAYNGNRVTMPIGRRGGFAKKTIPGQAGKRNHLLTILLSVVCLGLAAAGGIFGHSWWIKKHNPKPQAPIVKGTTNCTVSVDGHPDRPCPQSNEDKTPQTEREHKAPANNAKPQGKSQKAEPANHEHAPNPSPASTTPSPEPTATPENPVGTLKTKAEKAEKDIDKLHHQWQRPDGSIAIPTVPVPKPVTIPPLPDGKQLPQQQHQEFLRQ